MLLTEAHIKQEVNIDRSGNIVTTDSQQLYFSQEQWFTSSMFMVTL